MAAEQIHASYSALKISIPISALESYAKYGIINADLAGYYQYIPTLGDDFCLYLRDFPILKSYLLQVKEGKPRADRILVPPDLISYGFLLKKIIKGF